MTFTTKRTRTEPRWLGRPRAPVPVALVLRTVVLAIIAIGGAGWALARHYTHANPPMLVPAPPPGATHDIDSGELPAPELEPLPRP